MQDLVKKYSEIINFPIYLLSTKEVDVDNPRNYIGGRQRRR
jgi:HSP90 family molecular chaperone